MWRTKCKHVDEARVFNLLQVQRRLHVRILQGLHACNDITAKSARSFVFYVRSITAVLHGNLRLGTSAVSSKESGHIRWLKSGLFEHPGYSSVGGASDCSLLQQSDGPWFDSGWPDHGLTRYLSFAQIRHFVQMLNHPAVLLSHIFCRGKRCYLGQDFWDERSGPQKVFGTLAQTSGDLGKHAQSTSRCNTLPGRLGFRTLR